MAQTPLEMISAINTNLTRSLTRVRSSASNLVDRIYITELTLTLPVYLSDFFPFVEPVLSTFRGRPWW